MPLILLGLLILIITTQTPVGENILAKILIPSNNPGNLEYNPSFTWEGQVIPQPMGQRFAYFTEAKWGLRAMGINALRKIQEGYQSKIGHEIVNLKDFGNVWAEYTTTNPKDQYGLNLASYMRNHLGMTTINADDPFDFQGNIIPLMKAITHNEYGIQPYDDSLYQFSQDQALAKVFPTIV